MTSGQPDSARITPLDLGIITAGVVVFVFAFFGYYTASVNGVTQSTGAWHGFFAWFAAVLALLGALLLVTALLFPSRPFRTAPYRIVAVLFIAAAVGVLCALFTSGFNTSRARDLGVAADTGHGYGYWISLAAIIVGTALSLVGAQFADRRRAGPVGRLSIQGRPNRER